MHSIHTYLSAASKNRAGAQLVVIGNEAADLDSMASAIAYGYLRSLLEPHQSVVPVMPICRADFCLRPEAVYVFKESHLNLADIVFMDEVDLDILLKTAGLVLVDHNRISASLDPFRSRVVSVIDHHRDEGLYDSARPRIVTAVGSTASLVVQEFEKNGVVLMRDVAVLLGGTILLDTVNLKSSAGRVTELDLKAAGRVLPLCPLPQQTFYETVQKAKGDMTGFSTFDLLRKDYKEWRSGVVDYGIASVLLSVADWIHMDYGLALGCAAFADKRSLDVLLVMSGYTKQTFNRDLIIFCTSQGAHDELFSHLQQSGLLLSELSWLEPQEVSSGCIGFYNQGASRISRKRLQPLLDQLYG